MSDAVRIPVVLTCILVAVSIVGAAAFAGSAVADQHTKEAAPSMNDKANFTTVFPYQTDHYPGDQNQENGSIEYYAAGEEAFAALDAEEGVWINYVIIDASWIDYTACSTENTKVFGIDRGNNNSGTKIDEDLVQHQEKVNFRDDGITVNFLDWADFAGDPPYLAPEDAIVAAQGAGSNAGPCLTLTSEPGWYQIEGFMNGTIATGCTEEGNANCEPENKQRRGVNVDSNYMYVCECENEQEARDQLGPKPGNGGGGATPTPTPGDVTPTPTATPGDATTTPERTDGTPTPTESDDMSGGTPTDAATPTPGAGGDGPRTPSGAAGPGFGTPLALVALLGSALLVRTRH